MKKLYSLILRTYIGPFVMTFFISLFILLMQFLWKYVDDLVGKGLEWYVIGELLFYASATFVPMALPLAILLSSIMNMGKLGENYELVALKSAGISLTRILTPLVYLSAFFVIAAFYFSNNVLPNANLKMGSLLYDVRQQRPAFNILEGIYYKGIDNFVIRAEQKDSDGSTLRGIKIYDHSERRGNVNLTTAEWGTMLMTEDKTFLVLTLYNGYNYQEVKPENPRDDSKPFQRTKFEKQVKKFDLSAFSLTRTDQDLFRSNFRMLDMQQLTFFEDSLGNELQKRKDDFMLNTLNRIHYFNSLDSLKKESLHLTDSAYYLDIIAENNNTKIKQYTGQSMNLVRQIKETSIFSHQEFKQRRRSLARYEIEYQRKFTLSIACLLLFMIGAPLGAIIRKGGFGLPVVVSVLFFVFFHVVSVMGEKFVRESVLQAWQGMWLSSLLILPVAIILILQATTDSPVLDMDTYKRFFSSMINKIRIKKNI